MYYWGKEVKILKKELKVTGRIKCRHCNGTGNIEQKEPVFHLKCLGCEWEGTDKELIKKWCADEELLYCPGCQRKLGEDAI